MAEQLTKQEKVNRMAQTRSPVSPLPQVPKLPESFKTRFPELAEDIDRYNTEWEAFFKALKQQGSV